MAPTVLTPSGVNSFARKEEEQPIRLLPSVPLFPVHVLPEPSRSLVIEGAAAIGVPADLIAAPFLAFAAGAIGRSRQLELKPDWVERPALFVAVIAPPGSAKTPSLRLAQNATEVLQQEAYELHQVERAGYEAELAAWAAKGEVAGAARPSRPVLRHFFTTDSTTEALTVLLRDSNGIVLVQDEFASLFKSMNAYRPGADRQWWLSAWSSTPLKVDRKGADPIYVPHPAISVVGGIQPDLLPGLHNELLRGDGLFERLLLSRPQVTPTVWSEAIVAEQTKEDMVDIFRRICHERVGSGINVCLDSMAKNRWVSWFNECQSHTAMAKGLEQGILAKLPSQAARLALVLHCLGDPDGQHSHLSLHTLSGALELADYFLAHAQLVLPLFASVPSSGLAGRILTLLSESDDWVSRGQLHQGLGGHVSATDLDNALEQLSSRELAIHKKDQSASGGRPSQKWRAATNPGSEDERIA